MDDTPNPMPAYVAAVLRMLFASFGGWLVNKGLITQDQLPELLGAAMVVFAFLWSLIQKRNAHRDLKSAIAAPAGWAK